MRVIGIELVLEARIASGASTFTACSKILCWGDARQVGLGLGRVELAAAHQLVECLADAGLALVSDLLRNVGQQHLVTVLSRGLGDSRAHLACTDDADDLHFTRFLMS
jgi:hypothetical protein